MAEQEPTDQTEAQEGNSEPVEAGTCGLGIVQGCCPDVQRNKLGKGCKKQQGSGQFSGHIGQKRKAKENIHPLINKNGELVTTDMEVSITSLPQSSLPVILPMSRFPKPLNEGWGS